MGGVMFTILMASSLLLLYSLGRVLHYIWWKPKSIDRKLRQQGIKGTPYKLFHGDLKEYGRSLKEAGSKPMNLTHHIVPRVVPFAYQTVQTYGEISFFWIGTTPALIILDPQLMKDVLNYNYKYGHIQKPPENPHVKLLTQGLSSSEREKWAKDRRIINPAFNLDKLKGMMPEFSVSCSKLIEKWKTTVGQGSYEMDVWPEIQNLTRDVISRAAFGINVELGKRIFELQIEQASLVREAFLSVYIPGFRFIPTKKNKRRMMLDKEIKGSIRDMIHSKLQARKNGESTGDDLLNTLLQSNNYLQEDGSNSNKNAMTMDEVIEECKLFYFAGQETSSTWLTWTMIVLAMNPIWQEKAREEVMQICGKNIPTFDNLNHFKIVTMILYEVLRLYPPVVHIFRYTYSRTSFGGISIPAGVHLVLPTLLIHHNRKLWGNDADEFNPERFSQGISKASKDQVAFFPFGWGPRICVGQTFAMIEVKQALAMILQHFSFQLSPSYTHAPHTIITLQPQHGAQIVLNRL